MRTNRSKLLFNHLLLALLFLLTFLISQSAQAQSCPRGQLSERFCDHDGDLVADAPTDPKEWVDPATLIFAYTPVEDPSVYAKVWDGFIKHMEKVTGKKVQFFPVQSNAAQLEAMRAGRLHVAGFNTGSNPIAVNCVGFVPFTIMASKDGSFGYEMEIITYPGSGITTPADLRGRTLAFTSPTSNSGFKAPSALLEAEFGMKADVDFKTAFSGKHDNSVLGVANKDYDAAAVANSVMQRMISRDVVKAEQIVSIYKSQTFPTTGYGHVYNLHPELAKKVKEAFFSFPWAGSTLEAEFSKSGEAQFIPITYKEHWAVVRTIDQAMKTKYECQ
ncbi:phosphate/phosphite/phosphonate ABC transporter substrate-binding protein [Chrysiogenes arsenatis]|uniref:phosphate/phosphite/phosphonate ABC transporter substrate-binding protein n=1 Tax=Chrysiogenes arsenatis TaxID=309797 RepID=UPI000414869A|nr:phosphate/phosphite/phosphonate ABC transporter substrate-binding protein [Chrysiogenes arsenatis]